MLLVLAALFAPLIATQDPIAQDLGEAAAAAVGARIGSAPTSSAATSSAASSTARASRSTSSLLVGGHRRRRSACSIGTVAGYLGGWVDTVLMRITDIFLAFPSLVLALAFVAALGPGIENAIIAIALTAWPPIARLARAETLTIRKADYIAAVRLQGASPLRIICAISCRCACPRSIVRLTLDMAGDHPDRGGPRLPRPRRAAADARNGAR